MSHRDHYQTIIQGQLMVGIVFSEYTVDVLCTPFCIDVGSHNMIFLVASSRDKKRVGKISAVVHVREKE